METVNALDQFAPKHRTTDALRDCVHCIEAPEQCPNLLPPYAVSGGTHNRELYYAFNRSQEENSRSQFSSSAESSPQKLLAEDSNLEPGGLRFLSYWHAFLIIAIS